MKAVIFDLDNTIFDVSQYNLSAFQEISNYLSNKCYIKENVIYHKLINLWKEKTSMYPHLFDDLLKYFNLNEDVKNLVDIFNNYNGKLTPYPEVIPILKALKKKKYKLGIITDGDVNRQKRKINLLGISKFFDVLVFTKDLGTPKPSRIPFEEAIKRLKIKCKKSYYIGDNPLIDFKGAKCANLSTIRIKKGEFYNLDKNKYIDIEIKSLNDLKQILLKIES